MTNISPLYFCSSNIPHWIRFVITNSKVRGSRHHQSRFCRSSTVVTVRNEGKGFVRNQGLSWLYLRESDKFKSAMCSRGVSHRLTWTERDTLLSCCFQVQTMAEAPREIAEKKADGDRAAKKAEIETSAVSCLPIVFSWAVVALAIISLSPSLYAPILGWIGWFLSRWLSAKYLLWFSCIISSANPNNTYFPWHFFAVNSRSCPSWDLALIFKGAWVPWALV